MLNPGLWIGNNAFLVKRRGRCLVCSKKVQTSLSLLLVNESVGGNVDVDDDDDSDEKPETEWVK